MQLKDPSVPCYEIFLGEDRVGFLFDPEWADMFWCSYRVVPLDEQWDEKLRNDRIWDQCLISVGFKDGTNPNPYTQGGIASCQAFCRRECDRITFRSLWPTDDMLVLPKSAFQKFMDWLLGRKE